MFNSLTSTFIHTWISGIMLSLPKDFIYWHTFAICIAIAFVRNSLDLERFNKGLISREEAPLDNLYSSVNCHESTLESCLNILVCIPIFSGILDCLWLQVVARSTMLPSSVDLYNNPIFTKNDGEFTSLAPMFALD